MTKDIAVIKKKIEFSGPVEILHFQKELSEYFIRHQLMSPKEATLAMIKMLGMSGLSNDISAYHIQSDEPSDHVTVTTIGQMLNQEMKDRGFEDVAITGEIMNEILCVLAYQTRTINVNGVKEDKPTELGKPFSYEKKNAGAAHYKKEKTKDGVTTTTEGDITYDTWSLHWRPCIVQEINAKLFANNPYETLLEWLPEEFNKSLHNRIIKALLKR